MAPPSRMSRMAMPPRMRFLRRSKLGTLLTIRTRRRTPQVLGHGATAGTCQAGRDAILGCEELPRLM